MLDFLNSDAYSPTPQEIARTFRWLGWTGFVLQILFGVVPLFVILANVLTRSQTQQWGGLSFGLWLAIICLAALIFSTFWCFRYVLIARKLENRDARPSKTDVSRAVKVGLITNLGIMIITVTIALLRVGELTFKMLRVPQGATMVVPGQIGTTLTPGALITPSNMIAIQAMINGIAAGLVGAIVALLLLLQISMHRSSTDKAV